MLFRINQNIFVARTIDGSQTIGKAILAAIDNVGLVNIYESIECF